MNIPVVIFIRSYRNDLEWLKYCLRSIEKFVTGHAGVVVVVPEQDGVLFRAAGIEVQTTPEADPGRGYLNQQVTKIHADEFCPPECWILYVDSDCVFTAPMHVDDFFKDGKPILLHTPYALLPKPPAMPWKALTERCLGFECHDETMRRHGAIMSSSELKDFREWFLANRGQTIDAHVGQLKYHDFSEFNVLGMWLWKFRHSSRSWIRTDVDPIPPLHLKQGYSWNGVTPAIRAEMEKILA